MSPTSAVAGYGPDRSGDRPARHEADKLLTKFLAEKDAKRVARSRINFGDACDRWLANLDVEVKTKHEYAGYLRRTLRPVFGAQPLAKVEALAVEVSMPSYGAAAACASQAPC